MRAKKERPIPPAQLLWPATVVLIVIVISVVSLEAVAILNDKDGVMFSAVIGLCGAIAGGVGHFAVGRFFGQK